MKNHMFFGSSAHLPKKNIMTHEIHITSSFLEHEFLSHEETWKSYTQTQLLGGHRFRGIFSAKNLYLENGCFNKHSLKTGCLEFQVDPPMKSTFQQKCFKWSRNGSNGLDLPMIDQLLGMLRRERSSCQLFFQFRPTVWYAAFSILDRVS